MNAKPRLLVLTDIGGDPDDQQSMIRLMTYANEFEIEGLLATSTCTKAEPQPTTRCDLIRRTIEAYGQVRPMLVQHDSRYPEPETLLEKVHAGNPARGMKAIGLAGDTNASQWIIRALDRMDPRPLNVAIWGGQTDLAQALWRIRHDRGEEALGAAAARLRVHDIGDQDGLLGWITREFPGLFYIFSGAPAHLDMRMGAYRGMYLGGDESLTSLNWIETHVLRGRGPLGALYPTKTWTAPNPHGVLKEGDTPSWFYFLPNGLGSASHPSWGGWGGRFERSAEGVYRDAWDTVNGTRSARASVWRWRDAYQRDFQARMDWCVRPPGASSHPPAVVLNDDDSREPVRVQSAPGQTVRLTAEGTSDPDGGGLSFRWWVYPEAGSCPAEVEVCRPDGMEAEIPLREDMHGADVHVILEVTNSGEPPLTRYRRAVISVRND